MVCGICQLAPGEPGAGQQEAAPWVPAAVASLCAAAGAVLLALLCRSTLRVTVLAVHFALVKHLRGPHAGDLHCWEFALLSQVKLHPQWQQWHTKQPASTSTVMTAGDDEAGVVEHALQGTRTIGSRIAPAAWLPPILAAIDRSGAAAAGATNEEIREVQSPTHVGVAISFCSAADSNADTSVSNRVHA